MQRQEHLFRRDSRWHRKTASLRQLLKSTALYSPELTYKAAQFPTAGVPDGPNGSLDGR